MIKVKVLETPKTKINVKNEIVRETYLVQADWNETDESQTGYIKNKPQITSEVIEGGNELITSGGVFDALKNFTGGSLIQIITWEDDD